MIKVFTCESERESAEQLGFEVHVEILNYANSYNNDVIIRWGNSRKIYESAESQKVTDFPNVINGRKAIRANCDKLQALKNLAEVVQTPAIYERQIPAGVSAVVRRLEHSHGSDFKVQDGPAELPPDFYGTEYINTETEFRVWFCGNATFHAKRVPLSEADEQAFPCRSNWGYSYRETMPLELHYATLLAAKHLGLETGAADVLQHNGNYIFLELNSAPTIDTNRLKRFYKENLAALIQRKFPNLAA